LHYSGRGKPVVSAIQDIATHMNPSTVSVTRLNQIEQARQEVLSEGSPTTPWVPDWVSQSWLRCLQQGMQPHFEVGFDPISQAQIDRTLDQNHEFVQAARPELARLGRAIAGTSFFALITDAHGVVVDTSEGIDRQDKRIEAIARVGVDLSESAVGTTAISAALTTRKPVWLHRGEHFFKDTSVYSCAGAPLWNGMGECIGMLDLTGVMSQERPELMHLAELSARSISNALLLRQPHHLLLRLNWPGRLLGDDNDGLVLLDSEGSVLGANLLARDMLNLARLANAHANDLFAIPMGLLFDAAAAGDTMEVPLWSGLHLHLQACLQHSCHTATQPATTGALRQIQSAMINQAISHAKGNVAQAAKALGISRATLYRKLARKTSH
jgi:transcriptional regulator of acetoin/glycerol metabolism